MKQHSFGKYHALAAATALLALNFWAWSLLSPLATAYADEFGLSPFKLSVVLAAPVLVGSLGRIPFGLLTDRLGGRKMFAVVSWLAAGAVIWLNQVSSSSALLVAALALGLAGISFAVGVPFINAWFPKRQRGFALGIYAIGDAGTAVAGVLTPRLADAMSRSGLFWALAAALLISGILMYLLGQDSPSWRPAKAGIWRQLSAALRWSLTWKLSLLYALTFGAFVSLGLYLPVLLNQSYGLHPSDAADRAAGFVLLATLVRPVGGWLSDRFSGLVVLRVTFALLFGLALLAALAPSLAPLGTLAYLGMAVVLGVGSGAIFAVIGHRADAKLVGAISGVVGAAGGLGGYFPPLVMGLSWQIFGAYGPALLLLALAGLIIVLSLRRLFGYGIKY